MTVTEILTPWTGISTALGLDAPVRDAAHYQALLDFVDECFERFGADDGHPIFSLVDLVGQRISEYERREHPWPEASTPATRLAFLMAQHGLRQCDLPEIGAQSVVSAVLTGKRALNLRQTRALALRFSVPLETFVS
jgi:HTH-type transcriptional regulator / antitoxin HigA